MKKLLCLVICLMLCCSALAEFPVTVTDAAGRLVTIDECPERIVSGYYISTSALLALGCREKLVGIEAKAGSRALYTLGFPEMKDKVSVGTAKQFDLEAALSVEPDLIVLPVKLRDALDAIGEIGIPVILVDPETMDDLIGMLHVLAEATGSDSERVDAFYAAALGKLDELNAGIADDERPVVYLAGNSDRLRTAGKGMYQDTLLRLGGGVNAAEELSSKNWQDISYEQLLAWDPDVIVLASDAVYSVEDVMNDAELSGLRAVAGGRVYKMPGGIEAWDSPVMSAPLGSLWLMSVLHPEKYTAEEFMLDAAGYYGSVYSITITKDMVG